MAIILHIDTAVDTASICLAENNVTEGFEMNEVQKEHSSWLHPAIHRILSQSGRKPADLDAVAVTVGPGSYTGLRVGLSAAKGLCFSLGKPLIAINTPELIAAHLDVRDADFIVPVIDARRMEVFTAVYDRELNELEKPSALILEENSYSSWAGRGKILFAGNAAQKVMKIIRHDNVLYHDGMPTSKAMTSLSSDRFEKRQFSDLAYIEPLYVKEFYEAKH